MTPLGLAVVYAVLGFQQITYVTEGILQAWQIAVEDLPALFRLREASLAPEIVS